MSREVAAIGGMMGCCRVWAPFGLWAVATCAAGGKDTAHGSVRLPAVRAELLQRAHEDQRARISLFYGTQFHVAPGSGCEMEAAPIEDEEHGDVRRKALGLPTMAENVKQLREAYKCKP